MKEKFVLFDGLRGLAAISAVMYHADATAKRAVVFPHGYLAVDFFFLLSGFVIAYNYQDRLDKSWSAKDFFKTRLVRLYPLYLLGLILGVAGLLLKNYTSHAGTSTSNLIGVVTLGALLLPMPQFIRGGIHGAFPLDYPAWSLFGEAVANVCHAFFFRRRSAYFIFNCFVASALLTGFSAFRYHGLSFGFYSNEILLAVPRVLMSYTAGVLVYRFWATKRVVPAWPGWMVCILLMLPLLCPRLGSLNAIYDMLIATLAFPAILIAGASANTGPRMLQDLFKYGGKCSYPIYILHAPILVICIQIVNALRHPRFIQSRAWTDLVFPMLVLALATVAYRQYDEPVRSILRSFRPFAMPQRLQPSAESTL
jgi:peptidoglycan/LPS O-acetylase OafA/YrhL